MELDLIDYRSTIEAEQNLLGGILYKGWEYSKARQLKDDDFHVKYHKTIWKAMRKLVERGDGINNYLVYEETKRLNPKDIDPEYQDALLAGAFIEAYDGIQGLAKTVKRNSINRKISNGETPKDDDLKSLMSGETDKVVLYDIGPLATEEIRRILDGKHLENIGHFTRWPKLNQHIGGLKNGDLIVIAGRPAMGKTSFAVNMALGLAEKKINTLYINLEMTAIQIVRKIISSRMKIDSNVYNYKIIEDTGLKFFEAGNFFMNNEISMKIADMGKVAIEEIRRLCQETKCKVLLIDQLLKIKREAKRERLDQEIAEITFNLKAMAKELSIPIVLLHQINRGVEQREDKMPTLSDLRDSGAVEQDADVILMIYRDNYYKPFSGDNSAVIRVAKNKMGKVGDIDFVFTPEYGLFEEKGGF